MKNHLRRFKSSLIHNNFLFGVGSTFNIFGNNNHRMYEKLSSNTDNHSIASDWAVIGNDFRKVLKGHRY